MTVSSPVVLRACDFFGVLAFLTQLSLLFAMSFLADIQKVTRSKRSEAPLEFLGTAKRPASRANAEILRRPKRRAPQDDKHGLRVVICVGFRNAGTPHG